MYDELKGILDRIALLFNSVLKEQKRQGVPVEFRQTTSSLFEIFLRKQFTS